MPDLSFCIRDVAVMPHTAAPTLAARLQVTNASPESIHSVLLNCQVLLEPLRREYSAAEEAKLLDLFGERERWARSMKPLLWTIAVLNVPRFERETEIDLPLPCSFDFDVAATKYFYGLEQGSIRGSVLFNGTIFYADEHGAVQIAQIPWQNEARFQLPVETWRAAIDAHYPASVWLRLSRETFDRLYRFKVANQFPLWEHLIKHLLDRADSDSSLQPTEATGMRR